MIQQRLQFFQRLLERIDAGKDLYYFDETSKKDHLLILTIICCSNKFVGDKTQNVGTKWKTIHLQSDQKKREKRHNFGSFDLQESVHIDFREDQ